jgi:hypothetical protein
LIISQPEDPIFINSKLGKYLYPIIGMNPRNPGKSGILKIMNEAGWSNLIIGGKRNLI